MEIQVEDLNKIKNGEKESITRPSVGMEVERRRAGIPPLETFKFIQSERVRSLMYNKKDIIRTLVLFSFLLFKEQHLHSVGLIHLGTIHCAFIPSFKKNKQMTQCNCLHNNDLRRPFVMRGNEEIKRNPSATLMNNHTKTIIVNKRPALKRLQQDCCCVIFHFCPRFNAGERGMCVHERWRDHLLLLLLRYILLYPRPLYTDIEREEGAQVYYNISIWHV